MLKKPSPQTEEATITTIKLQERCAISIVALLVSLVSALFLLQPSVASAHADYKCSTSTYCYGLNQWSSFTETWTTINGSTTFGTIVPMTCSGYCTHTTDHISNYLWLRDDLSGNPCPEGGHNPNGCWIQVGERDTFFPTPTPHVATMYYYDTLDATNGGRYTMHNVAGVPSADYGSALLLTITGNSPPSNFFYVEICTPRFCPGFAYIVDMIATTVTPDITLIGEEVRGTVGSAGLAHYTHNEWYDSTVTSHFFTDSGQYSPFNTSPPSAMWAVLPAPGNDGGDFITSCC